MLGFSNLNIIFFGSLFRLLGCKLCSSAGTELWWGCFLECPSANFRSICRKLWPSLPPLWHTKRSFILRKLRPLFLWTGGSLAAECSSRPYFSWIKQTLITKFRNESPRPENPQQYRFGFQSLSYFPELETV